MNKVASEMSPPDEEFPPTVRAMFRDALAPKRTDDELVFVRQFRDAKRQAEAVGDEADVAMTKAVLRVADLSRTHTLLLVLQALHLRGLAARSLTWDALLQKTSVSEAERAMNQTFSN